MSSGVASAGLATRLRLSFGLETSREGKRSVLGEKASAWGEGVLWLEVKGALASGISMFILREESVLRTPFHQLGVPKALNCSHVPL